MVCAMGLKHPLRSPQGCWESSGKEIGLVFLPVDRKRIVDPVSFFRCCFHRSTLFSSTLNPNGIGCRCGYHRPFVPVCPHNSLKDPQIVSWIPQNTLNQGVSIKPKSTLLIWIGSLEWVVVLGLDRVMEIGFWWAMQSAHRLQSAHRWQSA